MPKNLARLKPFDDDENLRVVVEVPRGSIVKLEYEPKLKGFVVSRCLPLGLTYPFDWGFIPGTRGGDGDPVDAIALHDSTTYPGVILPCRPIGIIEITERKNSISRTNNRIVAMPTWNDQLGEFEQIADLPKKLKEDLEQFFLNTSFFTSKKLKLKGWADGKAARRYIKRATL
jgi:inorganic pyrophosphatase